MILRSKARNDTRAKTMPAIDAMFAQTFRGLVLNADSEAGSSPPPRHPWRLNGSPQPDRARDEAFLA